MLSTIKLDGELDDRFDEIKNRLAAELGTEPTNEEVVEILMAEYSSTTANPPIDRRQE
jgi:hypothetical protein